MKRFLIIFLAVGFLIVFFGLLKFSFDKRIFSINKPKAETIPLIKKTETQITNKEPIIFEDDACAYKYIEKVGEKVFWCYTTPSCYDINTYKYNADLDIYTVDYMFDYDLSGNLGYNRSPYDEGYITHLIFETTFSPSKKIFNAKYKGFISSKIETDKETGGYYNKLLKIHYDTKTYIPGLEWHIKNFDNISKSPLQYYPINYLAEVTQCIPQQLKP